MTRRGLNVALALLAVVLGSLAVWQWRLRQVPPADPPQRSDYILRDFELTTLDKDGRESFTVVGPYLQRDVGGRSLSLVQPRFSFPDRDAGRWQARSDTAWVSPGADEVHLLDRVQMVGPPGETGLSTRFETKKPVVLPDVDQARTDDRVTVTQGDSILAGTGLLADMKAKRFQLQNDVKGRYAPRRP
jgi:lipopolysaccharide export system protein LptC